MIRVFAGWQKIGISALAAAAAVSVAQGFQNALEYSQDFQWSPSRILSEGRSPYDVYLAGNQNGEIILSQAPNYLHSLYIMLLPFGVIEFTTAKVLWASANILIAVALVAGFARFYNLSATRSIVVLLTLLCSTPFRNGLGNGQHALLMMALIYLPFLWAAKPAYLLQGLGWAKYSFAPPYFIFNLVKQGWRPAIATLILPVGCLLAFALYLDENVVSAAVAPLRVSSQAVADGTADLMTIVEKVFFDLSSVKTLSYILAIVFAIALSIAAARRSSEQAAAALLAVTSLISFKHLGYDFTFLLPVACYFAAFYRQKAAFFVAGAVFWFWFGLKILGAASVALDVPINSNYLLAANFFILLGCYISIYYNDSCAR